jgi:aminoglycoside phosphotransferase
MMHMRQSDGLTSRDSEGLPPSIREYLEGSTIQRVSVGRSACSVYSVQHSPGRNYFLKCGDLATDPDPGKSIEAEAMRLFALNRIFAADTAGLLRAPEVVAYAATDARCFLLTTACAGRNASEVPSHAEAIEVTRRLGAAIRALHSLPITLCPFDQRLEVKFAQAKTRVQNNLVDASQFEGDLQGIAPQVAIERVEQMISPRSQDLVICHGDCCLPNFILGADNSIALVDVGRLGIADRYQDLALIVRSILAPYNPLFGEEALDAFLQAYGISQVEAEQVALYQALEDFF